MHRGSQLSLIKVFVGVLSFILVFLSAGTILVTHNPNAMADQSEPARTVVDAAFHRCEKYETAFRKVQPYKQEIIDQFKSETMVPGLLDLVMSARAREKLGR